MAKIIYVKDEISQEERVRWRARRFKDDRVAELPQGFTQRSRGRAGSIYFRDGDRVLELWWELGSGPGVAAYVYLSGLSAWVWPNEAPVDQADRERIRAGLVEWLKLTARGAELIE